MATRSCALGSLAPGASATISLVIRGQVVGPRVNVVDVASAESDADRTDNVASALVHVVGATQCARLRASKRTTTPGRRVTLSATARSARLAPVWGVPVRLRGAGVAKTATTNVDGVAAFTVTPTRPGLMLLDVEGHSGCQSGIGVLGAVSPGVSG